MDSSINIKTDFEVKSTNLTANQSIQAKRLDQVMVNKAKNIYPIMDSVVPVDQ